MSAVTIVIPVYNEGENIRRTLAEIDAKLAVEAEVWLVYDNDSDSTLPPARALEGRTRIPFRLVRNKYGRGALNAIKTGLEDATSELVVVTLADLCDPPEVINDMVAAADREKADIVCASRYMKGGRKYRGPKFKGFLSHTAGLLLCWFARLPTHDPTNSFKLYRKAFLDSVKVESTGGFELGLELVVKCRARGGKIVEVPTTWRDRVAGKSNFKLWKWLPNYLKWFFRAFGSSWSGSKGLAILLFVVPVALFWLGVALYAPNAPWWDDFDSTLSYLAGDFPSRLVHIADFHNEHRLVIPRLVFEFFDLFPGRFPFLACTVFGDCILLGYVFFLGILYKRKKVLWFFVPFVWLFLDLANCENTLWTLTAIQSHAVLFFALISTFFFSGSERLGHFTLALLFAVFATATSASGLGVWPTLALLAVVGKSKNKRKEIAIVIACAMMVAIPYLIGFMDATKEHTQHYEWTVAGMFDFLFCFLGNIVPLAPVARLLGGVSFLALVFILINFRRLLKDPVFCFLIYLLSVVAAGVLCRSSLPNAGLFYRFEIIAISIFCCEVYLLAELLLHTRYDSLFTCFMKSAIPLAIVANLLAFYVGAPILAERKQKIEYGYNVWPQKRDQLVYMNPEKADKIMQAYFDRKFKAKEKPARLKGRGVSDDQR